MNREIENRKVKKRSRGDERTESKKGRVNEKKREKRRQTGRGGERRKGKEMNREEERTRKKRGRGEEEKRERESKCDKKRQER